MLIYLRSVFFLHVTQNCFNNINLVVWYERKGAQIGIFPRYTYNESDKRTRINKTENNSQNDRTMIVKDVVVIFIKIQ